MLKTLPQTRDTRFATRLAAVVAFAGVTAVAARVAIPFEPVPFTLQPLAVLLAGMVLGARDGALSQLLYVGLIASGLPIDARGLGPAALLGPTGGYLIGFAVAAWVAGFLVETGARRLWQRWVAGIAGVLALYMVGLPFLKLVTGLDWQAVWASGAALFLVPDLIKALIAAALAEGGRALLLRSLTPVE